MDNAITLVSRSLVGDIKKCHMMISSQTRISRLELDHIRERWTALAPAIAAIPVAQVDISRRREAFEISEALASWGHNKLRNWLAVSAKFNGRYNVGTNDDLVENILGQKQDATGAGYPAEAVQLEKAYEQLQMIAADMGSVNTSSSIKRSVALRDGGPSLVRDLAPRNTISSVFDPYMVRYGSDVLEDVTVTMTGQTSTISLAGKVVIGAAAGSDQCTFSVDADRIFMYVRSKATTTPVTINFPVFGEAVIAFRVHEARRFSGALVEVAAVAADNSLEITANGVTLATSDGYTAVGTDDVGDIDIVIPVISTATLIELSFRTFMTYEKEAPAFNLLGELVGRGKAPGYAAAYVSEDTRHVLERLHSYLDWGRLTNNKSVPNMAKILNDHARNDLGFSADPFALTEPLLSLEFWLSVRCVRPITNSTTAGENLLAAQRLYVKWYETVQILSAMPSIDRNYIDNFVATEF